ncbi:7TM diverse intracellular signaling domain-containing protein [uncultured Microscilla sp.]|uniref:7TM diverse intracellular signaling domain-containing protein n=1 Tax=uncultured Microscilla sp. TaxID=432653 RepID=UPI0026197CF1|nr:7TM diverse intracellular signaling domain-containing protein [uncultured Microscilla sp.]
MKLNNINILKQGIPHLSLIILLFLGAPLWAQNSQHVSLIDMVNEYHLGQDSIQVLPDPGGKLTIAQVSSPEFQSLFKSTTAISQKVQVYWVRFSSSANLEHEKDWVMSFEPWDKVSLYYANPKYKDYPASNVKKSGASLPMSMRDVDQSLDRERPFVTVPIINHSKQTFFIRLVGAPHFANRISPVLYSRTHILEKKRIEKYTQGLHLGFILTMVLYNLFIFLSVRDHSYLYYVLYLFFLGVIFMIDDGDGMELLWREYPWLDTHLTYFILPLVLIFNTSFTRSYLNTRINSPYSDRLLKILIGFMGLLMVAIIVFTATKQGKYIRQYYTIFYGLVAIIITINTGVAFHCIRIGFRPARYYLTANLNLFISFGIAIYFFWTDQFWNGHVALQIGSALEAVLFSLGLADRINTLKRDKEFANERIITQLRENQEILKENQLIKDKANKELSHKVRERTTQLEERNKEIEIKNTKITDSIRYAKTIQRAILPNTDKLCQAFNNYFLVYLPKDIVSGDFYWLRHFAEEQKTFIVVGDCTGHGVPAAFMSLIGTATLNEIVNQKKIDDPADILVHLHESIRVSLHQADGKNEDGIDLGLCLIEHDPENAKQRKVTYAGAKRNLLCVINNTQELIEVKGDRKSVGGMQREEKRVFTNHVLNLNTGDTLYLTSDGYTDQNGEQKKKYGKLKFLQTLTELSLLSLSEQRQELLQELKEHQGNVSQRDDITILGVRL